MAAASTTPAVTEGQAVRLAWTDPVFGKTVDQAGIVVAVQGEQVTVAPVAGHVLTVPAADVQPLVGDEDAAG